MNSNGRWQFRIDRRDIRKADLVDVPASEVMDGQAELRLRRFAMTANNMTYALLGNHFLTARAAPGYFEYFPTVANKGLLPVWGIAEVEASRSPDVPQGARVYGFLPLASHWIVTPSQVSQRSFTDRTAHRGGMPTVYNHYTFVDRASDFDESQSHLWVVFRPLLRTGYMIADQLRSHDYHGADDVIVLSASSKTALITAHCLRHMNQDIGLVGMTSKRNVDYVAETGVYDRALCYEDVGELDGEKNSVLLDLAGDGKLLYRIHDHLGEGLRHSLSVGKTHWNAPRARRELPGPRPESFFAPSAIAERVATWGLEEVRRRFALAWSSFMPEARRFIEVHIGHGRHNVPTIYRLLRQGDISPRNPQVIELD